MSQWSNSQDYVDTDNGEPLNDGVERAVPPKTVRCVILKDFCADTKRLGSGDCGSSVPQPPKRQVICNSAVDSVRLKNHLEWKKQKDMEYLRKKETERAEEQRRKEQMLREEKEKRRKEKQREEKIREWQRQKAREKEQRKRDEIVLKALEQEIKGVSQTLDKEKLIHEWIQLKNKQKQIEAEKKAEMLKREEESRALRRTLAEINYRQWKERTKDRKIILPKNGYQIFGPKPVPVVKEDWNHNFGSEQTEDRGTSARTAKSTVSMTSIRGSSVSRMDFGRKKSPGGYQLKMTRSKSSVTDMEGVPFRELGIPRMDSAQRWKSVENFISRHEEAFAARASYEQTGPSRHQRMPNGLPRLVTNGMDMLPSKNKLEIYLQPCVGDSARKPEEDGLRMYLHGLSDVNARLLIDLNEKLSANGTEENRKQVSPSVDNRRSRSCDKSAQRASVNRSSSSTATKNAPKTEAIARKKPKKTEQGPVADNAYCSRKPKARAAQVDAKRIFSNRNHLT
ncbi:UNVERIFIED_CONTAM: hypothetical protein PYX00_010265 [Menopon gallinae]|uniref:Uncharacterized protein n=1 Tax=Menopon gallinae TaxID=328185 RepID=A0AAW2HEP4_9NEOP